MSELMVPTFTAHCFFQATCTFTVEDIDPDNTHRRMEQHYSEHHERDMDRIMERRQRRWVNS